MLGKNVIRNENSLALSNFCHFDFGYDVCVYISKNALRKQGIFNLFN